MTSYKKLSRYRRSAAGYSCLWLGDDHVLLVTSSGYSEEYRRFYFSDIQALTIQKTNGFAVVNWILGGSAIFFAALIFTVPLAGAIVLGTFAGICALAVAVHSVLGPTCAVQVRTAIAAHPLEPLGRLRQCQKAFARLVPLIQQAQGELTPEQLAEITAPSPPAIAAPPVTLPP